jgi:hypothetical protein
VPVPHRGGACASAGTRARRPARGSSPGAHGGRPAHRRGRSPRSQSRSRIQPDARKECSSSVDPNLLGDPGQEPASDSATLVVRMHLHPAQHDDDALGGEARPRQSAARPPPRAAACPRSGPRRRSRAPCRTRECADGPDGGRGGSVQASSSCGGAQLDSHDLPSRRPLRLEPVRDHEEDDQRCAEQRQHRRSAEREEGDHVGQRMGRGTS